MITTMTDLMPIEGPVYDKTRPETKQAWLDFRRPGITATMVRDWGNASKRRKILEEKATGEFEDLSHIQAIEHGNRREPVIAEWVHGRYGIAPCDSVYARADNPRHLASPDGVSRDPFSGKLVVGKEAVLAEIKTSKHDLKPGTLDETGWLLEIAIGSDFDRSGYFIQMQWQMYVMNAVATLFVWEQHDNVIDPETGTFTPLGPPQIAWIPRDEALIQVLVEKQAPRMLAEIDAAMTSLRTTELPPASEFPGEDVVLVSDVLKGRDAEAVARASRERAWNALGEKYLGPDKPDISIDLGIAQFTISTSTPAAKSVTRWETDWDAVREGFTDLQRKKYDALVAKHSHEVTEIIEGKPTQRMTITAKKGMDL